MSDNKVNSNHRANRRLLPRTGHGLPSGTPSMALPRQVVFRASTATRRNREK
jgi:hypothetical protein